MAPVPVVLILVPSLIFCLIALAEGFQNDSPAFSRLPLVPVTNKQHSALKHTKSLQMMARGGGLRDRRSESKRQARVGQLLRSELSNILLRGHQIKTEDPLPDELRRKISILDIQLSPDIRSANIFVTIYGDTFEKREAFAWLTKNTKAVRHALARKLSDMRGVPELYFRLSDVSAAVDLMHLIDSVSDGPVTPQENYLFDEEEVPSGKIGGLDFDDEL